MSNENNLYVENLLNEIEMTLQNNAFQYSLISLFFTEAYSRVIDANLKFLVKQTGAEEYPLELFEEKTAQKIVAADLLPSYNINNVFAWLKRLMRLKRKYEEWYVCDLKQLKRWEHELSTQLDILQKQSEMTVLTECIKQMIKQLQMEQSADLLPEGFELLTAIDWINLLMIPNFELPKQDFLQLISIDHKNPQFPKEIDTFPDSLSYPMLKKVILGYEIEDKADCYLFDILQTAVVTE